MTTTVNATLPQDDPYVKMVEYATNLKLTECRVGTATGFSHTTGYRLIKIKMAFFYLYFIRNTTFATAVTFLSIEDVSFIPISETFVESTGVIWNTPIFTD